MEFKDSAPPMLAAALALLLLALFTGTLLFYAAFAILFLFIVWDLAKLFIATSSLKNDLTLTSSLSRYDLHPGASAAYTVKATYKGRLSGIVITLAPLLDGSIAMNPAGTRLRLRKGEERSMSLDLVPSKPGDYPVGAATARVSSLMFSDTLDAGEPKSLRVRLSLGEHILRPNSISGHRRFAASPGRQVEKRSGSDFSGVRLYMPGDNVKNIDWGLSSRAGDLVVREFEAEKTVPVYFLIDLSPASFEATTAAVTALIDRQLAEGDRTGLICFSRSGTGEHVRMGMGREHIRRLSDVLSKLHAVDDGVSAGPNVSTLELYDAGKAIREASGVDVLKPVIEETFKGYIANVREDGFIKAIMTAVRDSRTPCEIRVVTGLSMGLPSLTNGLRLAQYYGHSVSTLLVSPPGGDHEQAMALKYAEKRLKAQSVKVISGMETSGRRADIRNSQFRR